MLVECAVITHGVECKRYTCRHHWTHRMCSCSVNSSRHPEAKQVASLRTPPIQYFVTISPCSKQIFPSSKKKDQHSHIFISKFQLSSVWMAQSWRCDLFKARHFEFRVVCLCTSVCGRSKSQVDAERMRRGRIIRRRRRVQSTNLQDVRSFVR